MMDLPWLALRAPDSHKGHFGLVLVIGGSQGMGGAAALAGRAALRGGAGLVRVAVPDVCQATVAALEPSYMTVALPSDRKGRIARDALEAIRGWAESATVVACGPGLGRSLGLDYLLAELYRGLARPAVFDADGLNALASRPDVLSQPAGPRVLTPHPGEFARLVGRDRLPPDLRHGLAIECAARWGVVLVLKGQGTLVTDGQRWWTNPTGNPGMATGGSGDVLTGLIAALMAQKLAAFDAARLGVFLHGLAGDLAAGQLGQEALIARDLVDFLPAAFMEYRRRSAAQQPDVPGTAGERPSPPGKPVPP